MVLKCYLQESHLLAFQSLKKRGGGNIANNFRQTQPVNDRWETNIFPLWALNIFCRPIYYHGIALIQSKTISRGCKLIATRHKF